MSADFHTGTLTGFLYEGGMFRQIEDDDHKEEVLVRINTFIACGVKTVYPGMKLQYEVDPRPGDRPVAINLTVIE